MTKELAELIGLINSDSIEKIAAFLNQHENVLKDVDNSGENALIHAVKRKNLPIVQMILEKDHSTEMITATKFSKLNAFALAIEQGCSDIVNAILAKNNSKEVINSTTFPGLIRAVKKKNVEILKIILEKNCSDEVWMAVGPANMNVLMYAAVKNDIDIAQFILTKNSSLEFINAKNSNGTTALMVAVEKKHNEIINLILSVVTPDKFVEVINQQNRIKETALMYAVKFGNEGATEAILEKCKSEEIVNIKDHKRTTALMLAVQNNNLSIVKAILKHHYSNDILNIKIKDGKTPLIWAAEMGYVDIVNAILDKNASSAVIEEQDGYSTSAISYARRSEHKNIVEILESALKKSRAKEAGALKIEVEQARLEKQKKIDEQRKAERAKEEAKLKAEAEAWPKKNEEECKGKKEAAHRAKNEKFKQLTELIKKELVDEMVSFIDDNPDVLKEKDGKGNNAFIHAVKSENREIVSMILEKNSTSEFITANNNKGTNGLMIAVSNNDLDIFERIIAKNSSPEILSAAVLRKAAQSNHFDILKIIFNTKPPIELLIHAKNDQGFTALMHAIANDNVEMVKAILVVNSSIEHINAQDSLKRTALMYAASKGNLDIVNAILEANSSIEPSNAQDLMGKTALMIAVSKGNLDIVKAILEANSSIEFINVQDLMGQTALMIAVSKGNLDIVNAILEKNNCKEIHTIKNNTNKTALMQAAAQGNFKIVNAILESPRLIQVINPSDIYEAILLTRSEPHTDVVEALEKALRVSLSEQGADQEVIKEFLNSKNLFGRIPLIEAATSNDLAMVKIILEANNSTEVINGKDHKGDTALMIAASIGNVGIVKSILNANSDIQVINARGYFKKTALMHAASNGKVEIVKAILEKNNSQEIINAESISGQSVLVIAANEGNLDVVKAILESKESIHVNNQSNIKKAIDIADKKSNPDMVIILNKALVECQSKQKADVKATQKKAYSTTNTQKAGHKVKEVKPQANEELRRKKIETTNESPTQELPKEANDIIKIQPHKQVIIAAMMAANQRLGSVLAGQNSLGQGKSKKKKDLETLMDQFIKSQNENEAFEILNQYWTLAADPRKHTFTTFKRAEPGKTNSALAFRQYIDKNASTELKKCINKMIESWLTGSMRNIKNSP